MVALQPRLGNRAMARLLAANPRAPRGATPGIQTKLRLGAVNDQHEREADAIAGRLGLHSGAARQEQPAAPRSGHGAVQRMSPLQPAANADAVEPGTEAAIQQARGGGQPLDDQVRHRMQSGLGVDFQGVRVHTDDKADQLNRSLSARAFTTGRDIFFSRGQYAPDSGEGRRLLAHELTHVVQQGAAGQAQAPAVQRQSPTVVQRAWWDRFRRRKGPAQVDQMTDTDVVSQEDMGGGTANKTYKVNYNRPIGSSGASKGVFKPDSGGGVSHRAVASRRLDKAMGLNILSDDTFAQHGGEKGVVSPWAKGVPLFEQEFNTLAQDQQAAAENAEMGLPYKQDAGGQWYERSGTKYRHHDFSNPVTQKGLADLQLLDAITGQVDRHGGNILIDRATGKVTGIDNDQALLRRNQAPALAKASQDEKYVGLPSMVDAGTAKKVLKMKAKNLPKLLRQPGDEQFGKLSDDEIAVAQERLRAVKAHVKQLKKQGGVVKKWGAGTYQQALNEADKDTGWSGKTGAPNYLKRSVGSYQNPNANAGEYSEPAIPSRTNKPRLRRRPKRRERESLSL